MKKLILVCISVGLCQTFAWSQAAKRTTTPTANKRSTLRTQIEATKTNTADSATVNAAQVADPTRKDMPVRTQEAPATSSAVARMGITETKKVFVTGPPVSDGVTSFRISDEGRKMIPLIEHRPEDIIWSRRVWRRIPLQERVNRPLYFPVNEDKLRKSLSQTLIQGLADGSLRAFDPDVDDKFSSEISLDQVLERADALDKSTTRKSLQTGKDTSFMVQGFFPYADIKELLIKEDWFFDKHYSRMFIRIVGICPVRVYNKTNTAEGAEDENDVLKKQLFWINYDQARPALAQQKMFLDGNDRTGYSFDDLFLQRRFSSYIIKESSENVSASIHDYIKNEYQQMLEGERIQNKLLNFEQDLWEY